ncbi:MAG: hypothetical protein GY812_07055 [Actinomycetia bacterium]|nr:hypothetical protein [Actinomycetes bacterium]
MITAATGAGLLAQDDFEFFLGEDFWPWMILALGAALVVGNVLALVRPPADVRGGSAGNARKAGDKGSRGGGSVAAERPPLARSVVLIVLGLAASAWGLASLLA